MDRPASTSYTGKYKRKTGLQRTYSYMAAWRGNSWEAAVWVGNEVKGYPQGTLSGQKPSQEAVISRVEDAIEKLVRMAE